MTTQLHGWYSEKCAKLFGTTRYRTPDGGEDVVTAVSDGAEHGSSWDDTVFVCMVTEYIGQGAMGLFCRRQPTLPLHYEEKDWLRGPTSFDIDMKRR